MAEFRAAGPKNGPVKFLAEVSGLERGATPNLPNFNNNWQKLAQKFVTKFFTALFLMILGVAGLRPNFFSSG
jgi:hypothetical protein